MPALKYADRIAESTVYVGTGDITLAGAIDTDHSTFASAFADGDEMPVSVFGGGKWMTFRGHYNAGANSLTRTTFRSSSTGANLALSGTMTVVCGWDAADAAAMIRTDEAQSLNSTQQTQGLTNLGVSIATQANQESASSASALVTPGRQQYHPSAAKVFAEWSGSATGAPTASYNVSGNVVRNSVGNYTISFTTPFSSSNYVAVLTGSGGSALNVPVISSKLAGSVTVYFRKFDDSQMLDMTSANLVCYGDQ